MEDGNLILVSIIIPYYNSAKSLKKLLLTIPKINEIEILVIDDRSSEDIEEFMSLMNEPQNKNIIVLYNNEKKGAGTCRNIGINNSHGKWLLFADSDDFYTENLFRKIEKYIYSNNDVVFFTPTSSEVDTNKISDRHIRYKRVIDNYMQQTNDFNNCRLRYNFPVPWSKLVRKDFLEEFNISFDEVIASNDIMFSTKLGYYMREFDVTDETIYCVTRGSGTLTMKKNESILDSRIETYIRWINFLESKLNKKDFKFVGKSARGYVYETYKNGYGIMKALSIYRKFRKNRIKIFEIKLLNPKVIYDKIIFHNKKNITTKTYMVNDLNLGGNYDKN